MNTANTSKSNDVDIISWWKDFIAVTDEEKAIIETPNIEQYWNHPFDQQKYNQLTDRLFSKLIYRDRSPYTSATHALYLDYSGHEAAEKLLPWLDDGKTLFVYSDREHHLIEPILSKTSNRLVFNLDTSYAKIQSIVSKIKATGLKRVVTYTIGLTNMGDIETNHQFVRSIQQILRSSGIEVISILDDVQSMMTLPKSYSMYDFVLYTGHSMVRFDCGMIIANRKYDLSTTGLRQSDKVLEMFLRSLEIVLSKISRIFYLDYVVKTYIQENQLEQFVKFEYHVSQYRIILTCKQIPLELVTSRFGFEDGTNSIQFNNLERVVIYNINEKGKPVTKIHIRATDLIGDEMFLKTFLDHITAIYKTGLVK